MDIIYVTGLGDDDPKWQFRVVMRTWQLYGIRPHFFRVGWTEETLTQKLRHLTRLIDDLYTESRQPVGVVGVSAGASLALQVFISRPESVAGVVTICGKILHPENVGQGVKRQNRAFAESMSRMPDTLQALTPRLKDRLLCIYPLTDRIVATQEQHVAGAHSRRVFSFGHIFSIAVQIVFGARKNIRFLKQHSIRAIKP